MSTRRHSLRAASLALLALGAQSCGAYQVEVELKLDPVYSYVSINGSEPKEREQYVVMTFDKNEYCVLQVFHPERRPFYKEFRREDIERYVDRNESIPAYLQPKF